jgi:hypothetical protein
MFVSSSFSCYIYFMSVTQTVEIPTNHRLTIDVPPEVPTGRAIISFTPQADIPQQKKQREFGCAKGEFWMADDFDAPLEDFKDYM